MGLTRPKLYQFDTSVNTVTDPITVLHAGATLANVDVGFLVNRANGLLSNVAIYWSESGQSFVTAYTTSSGGTDSNITVTSYAPIIVGNVITTNGVFWANGTAYSSGSGGSSFTGGVVPNVTTFNANLVAGSGTASTSTTTGALVVAGGAGISGALNVGGVAKYSGGNVFVSPYSGNGGLTINQFGIWNEQDSNNQVFQNWTNGSGTTPGAGGGLWTGGGGLQVFSSAELTFSMGRTLRSQNYPTGGTNASGQNIVFSSAGQVTINNNQASTSATTGALIVAGGAGIAGNVNIGGSVSAGNITTTNGVFWANGAAYSIGSAGAKITTSSTAPVSPNAGDFWYDPTTDIKSQYVNDGVASYWVDETGPTISNAAPVTTVGNIVGTTGGNAYITGTLIPTSNIAYDLGTTTQRFRSLYLSGNTIDLGGASIKTDATTGAIAFVPQATAANPNPTGIVVSPSGTISTVATTGGVLASNAISVSSNASAASGSTFSNANVTATLTAGNITITNGVFWANGTSALVSSYGNIQVASYLPAYSGNVNAANVVTTSGVYSPAYFYANGVAFTSSSYGNTQVGAYLPTYTGNIAGHGVAGNLTVYGNISVTNAITTTSLTETSSLLLKENVRPIEDPFEILLQLVGVVYDRKDGSSFGEPGLIAEAVALISSALVSKNADGMVEGVKYTRIIAYLIEAVKHLKQSETQNNKIISDLIQSVEELKTEINLLRGGNNGNP